MSFHAQSVRMRTQNMFTVKGVWLKPELPSSTQYWHLLHKGEHLSSATLWKSPVVDLWIKKRRYRKRIFKNPRHIQRLFPVFDFYLGCRNSSIVSHSCQRCSTSVSLAALCVSGVGERTRCCRPPTENTFLPLYTAGGGKRGGSAREKRTSEWETMANRKQRPQNTMLPELPAGSCR